MTHPCFLLFSSRHPGPFHHQHTECDRSKGPSTKDNIATSQIKTGMDVRGHSLSLLSTRLDNLLIRGAQSVKKKHFFLLAQREPSWVFPFLRVRIRGHTLGRVRQGRMAVFCGRGVGSIIRYFPDIPVQTETTGEAGTGDDVQTHTD